MQCLQKSFGFVNMSCKTVRKINLLYLYGNKKKGVYCQVALGIERFDYLEKINQCKY